MARTTRRAAAATAARVIDLDAARAARAEAAGEPVTIKLDGRDYTLPVEVPVLAMIAADRGDAETMIRLLLGDGGDEFLAKATVQDVAELDKAISGVYGFDQGE